MNTHINEHNIISLMASVYFYYGDEHTIIASYEVVSLISALFTRYFVEFVNEHTAGILIQVSGE